MDVVSFASGDLLMSVIALIGAGWGMMRYMFATHEKNINEKLKPISEVLHDVKRLELEQIRLDSKMAITYATKDELVRAEDKHTKVVERIFSLIQVINDKLDRKVDRDECRENCGVNIRKEPRQ